MRSLLEKIAKIRAGYSFRGRIEPAPDGAYSVVQIRDLEEGAFPAAKDLMRTNLPDVNSNHLLQRGDVLFAARGVRKQAVVVEEVKPNTIFGSQFFVCEPKQGVDPAYLAWYINQTPAQRYLEENATGSNVRIVTKEVLGRLPVVVPPLARQMKIADVYRLSLRERQLSAQIQEKRGILIETALLESIRQ
jgi:Type I restriction modification DNA specificity domain